MSMLLLMLMLMLSPRWFLRYVWVQRLAGPTAFPQYDWEVKDGFSDTGLGLMRALLAPDPGKRMSAAEALDHPWVSGADVYNVPI